MRACVFVYLWPLQVAYFDMDENTTGRLTSRLAVDAALIRATTGDRIGLLIQNNISFLGGIAIAFYCEYIGAQVLCWGDIG